MNDAGRLTAVNAYWFRLIRAICTLELAPGSCPLAWFVAPHGLAGAGRPGQPRTYSRGSRAPPLGPKSSVAMAGFGVPTPPIVEPIYDNVLRRVIVFFDGPCHLLHTWPAPFNSISYVVRWLGFTYFGNRDQFYKPGLALCGPDCLLINPELLDAVHDKVVRAGKPAPYAWKGGNRYITVTMHGVRTATPVALHSLLCWWAYGPPPAGHPHASHYACEMKRCLCLRHLR